MAAEKRLIDADELLEFIKTHYCQNCNSYRGLLCGACSTDTFMCHIETAPTVNQWISVAEQLPDNNHPVLVRCTNTTIGGGHVTHIGSCDMKKFWFLRTQPGLASFPVQEWQVTHWMPLPEPPKEG